jgi:y4mF family transcriptional regulator
MTPMAAPHNAPRRIGLHHAASPERESAVSVGAFVRSRRVANKLTQAELGALAGVGQRFVSEVERGKPTVRLDAVNRLLAAFGKRLGVVDAPQSIDPGRVDSESAPNVVGRST